MTLQGKVAVITGSGLIPGSQIAIALSIKMSGLA